MMDQHLTIEAMPATDIDPAIEVWRKQFSHFCSQTEIFPFWFNNTNEIKDFLCAKAAQGKSVVAKSNGKIVGYLAYDAFVFHGANSAICHFCGNASEIEGRVFIYLSLYREISKKWVGNGIANHYITISSNDSKIKEAFFDLGFGSYLVDAFTTNFGPIPNSENPIEIVRSRRSDAGPLHEIVKESRDYYSLSPIFLKMEPYPLEKIIQLIETSAIMIARDQGVIVGFFNLRCADRNDLFRMSRKGFGMIDEIGAYIKEEYRGKNIGNAFIQALSVHCQQYSIPCIHVDFESANLYANRFWKKFFTPTMLSLKRTVHPDAIG